MPSKREIIELLKREELQILADQLELDVRDRRVKDDLVDSIVRSKRARVTEILAGLPRDRLKDICIGLELDASGREKSVIMHVQSVPSFLGHKCVVVSSCCRPNGRLAHRRRSRDPFRLAFTS
ncbi:MAG: hypothetical protein JNK64_21695 [Myxococcales bacterium]|nr:hypothetical protein [Myxococcales bacterium]